MRFLQEFIHKAEALTASRYARWIIVLLATVLLALTYDLCGYRNMSTQEAMDAAQLGRNLAEGKGYTTHFVRPFSMYLVKRVNETKLGPPKPEALVDYSRVREPHPDISNAPAYPVLLAGLMKVLPFEFEASATKPFWSEELHFLRYQPDFLIALFNQALFLIMILLAFLWAQRLFDRAVAWVSAVLLLGTELLWRFTVSGLSTTLLLLIFMGIIWCLTLLESGSREPRSSNARLYTVSAVLGLLLGIGTLTRYSFMWLLIPALVFLVLFTDSRRVILCLITVLLFAAVVTPWIVRNVDLSGAPFGTASYSALEDTRLFPGDRLERSLEPNLRVVLRPVWLKLFNNTRNILQGNFSSLGSGWVTALFLAGLLVGFRNPTARRMRYFLMSSLGALIIVQAMIRTHLTTDSPDINSENLLVLLTPLIVIYGVSFFFVLLDQVKTPFPLARRLTIALFSVIACLPMIFVVLPPRTNPVAYPPYDPLQIQEIAAVISDKEWMMSDVPWAVAWYGNRQAVWTTLNATKSQRDPRERENFFTIHDYRKPISAVYFTERTLDSRFVSDWVDSGELSWGSFITTAVLLKKMPVDFPLQEMRPRLLPRALFVTDRMRTRATDASDANKSPDRGPGQ